MKYTQKQINYIIEQLMASSHYSLILNNMTPNEQKNYAEDYANNVIKNIPLYSDALLKQMMNIDNGDLRTYHIVLAIIEDITNIKITGIKKLDKEMVRYKDDTKTGILDNHFLINDCINIDIEGQRSIDDSLLLVKNQFYNSGMYFNYNPKGVKEASKYHEAILICIYEEIYHGNYKDGIVEDMNDFIKLYQPMSSKYGPDKNNKLYVYIVELGKIENIAKKKGIENMDRIESIGYAFNFSHIMEREVQKNIEKLYEKEPVVKDMIDMRNEFKESPSYYMHVIKEHIDHVVERSQGRIEEREEQRQKYYQRVLKRFKMNYCEDPEFLIDLSLENYEEIYEMIIDNTSIEDIEAYVESVKN